MVKWKLKEQVREGCTRKYGAGERRCEWRNKCIKASKKYLKSGRERLEGASGKGGTSVYISSLVMCWESDLKFTLESKCAAFP